MSPLDRPFLRRATAAFALSLSAVCAVPGGADARPTDNELLSAIALQAPNTRTISAVVPSPSGERLAVVTTSRAPGERAPHTNLWVSREDGTELQPIEVADHAGSGTEYISVRTTGWSPDSRALAYDYANSSFKYGAQASLVWFGHGVEATIQDLGPLTRSAAFTADGRFFTFTQWTSIAGPSATHDGAVDLASRDVLLPARTVTPAVPGRPAQPTTYAAECARAQEADWTPSASTGGWMEQALSSPDPGCRFGANANDPAAPVPSPSPSATPTPSTTPTATPTPDTAGASDAPANITRPAEGTGLVPISDRTTPLGPTLRLRSSAKGLTRAMRRGLRIQLDVAGATSLKAYVLVARPSNENLFSFADGSTTFTIGRLSLDRPPSQRQTIAIPFTKDARKVLPRFLKITVTVRLVATDTAGHRTVVERQVALTDF